MLLDVKKLSWRVIECEFLSRIHRWSDDLFMEIEKGRLGEEIGELGIRKKNIKRGKNGEETA